MPDEMVETGDSIHVDNCHCFGTFQRNIGWDNSELTPIFEYPEEIFYV